MTEGQFLLNYRLKNNLTQQNVSDKLGYSTPQIISNIERDMCQAPLTKIKILQKLYDFDKDIYCSLKVKIYEAKLKSALKIGG